MLQLLHEEYKFKYISSTVYCQVNVIIWHEVNEIVQVSKSLQEDLNLSSLDLEADVVIIVLQHARIDRTNNSCSE